MKLSIHLFVLILFYIQATSIYSKNVTLKITKPVFDEQVARREVIEGTVSDPNTQVWVVIYPMRLNVYFVQPKIHVNTDGTWNVMAYFGEVGTPTGTPFEVFAIANPSVELQEDMLFKKLPQVEGKSDYIRVYRK